MPISPDISKDLEKDEREFRIAINPQSGDLSTTQIKGAPLRCEYDDEDRITHYPLLLVVPEARLQQVEADYMALVEVKRDREKEIRERDRLLSIAREEIVNLREIIAKKDLTIKVIEEHAQYWEGRVED